MRGRGALFPPTVRFGGSCAGAPPSFSEQAARRPIQVFLFNTASPLQPHTHTHTHVLINVYIMYIYNNTSLLRSKSLLCK